MALLIVRNVKNHYYSKTHLYTVCFYFLCVCVYSCIYAPVRTNFCPREKWGHFPRCVFSSGFDIKQTQMSRSLNYDKKTTCCLDMTQKVTTQPNITTYR